ncbi:MAG: NADH-quinone oxidoreductase subunit M [Candidatus Dadabacteria bacterium]|nr:NADH-quinone oxidoreductase subunit M [Candidatus Dadabacteria bacterium]
MSYLATATEGNLTLITFLPLAGVCALALLGLIFRLSDETFKKTAFGLSVLVFLASVPLFTNFEPGGGMQFTQNAEWMPELGVAYGLGVDWLSLTLVILTTFLTPFAILSSWNIAERKTKEFFSLILIIETAVVGTLAATDMILFFLFWEAALIPMYFLIGVWGTERRVYAAVKFFLYTAFGSALMLGAIFYLYAARVEQFGSPSMAIEDLVAVTTAFDGFLSPQGLLFAAFFLAFAIKVPVIPFHTWLPDAHVEAPTAGSVILAGILLKLGVYGILRMLFPFFPDASAAFMPFLSAAAIVGIIYGAMVAFSQKDLKKLVAYSSVSHMGIIVLGVTLPNIQGVEGAVFHMLAHGVSTGSLFMMVGMMYERRHSKKIADFGGVAAVMPVFAAFFILFSLASAGLPLLSGFVGEFLVLLGAFRESYLSAGLAATGIVLGAVYMLKAVQKVFFGPVEKEQNKKLTDLTLREIGVILPMAAIIVALGVYPKPFLSRIEPGAKRFIAEFAAQTQTGKMKAEEQWESKKR